MSDTGDRALEVLADVLEAPEPQRVAVLGRACAGDAALRAEVERLLGLGPKLSGFLEALPVTQAELLRVAAREARAADPGAACFGRYRVVRLIGEGGMGSVYEAEQDHPRRRVALKVIRVGMDSRSVIARFEAEREALARMDHPNIAKVFDGGATDSGRPYFAMELVDGIPVTDYCDRNALTVRERLELMIPVCRAVQHAHQKGIIHRDLKPSNVLVTTVDGRPVPKVIDFGVAKATGGQPLTEQTLVTEVRQLVGTPEYMSPEQAGAGGGDVDTRSDVYGLGVLLYELLTGTTPFGHARLRKLPYEEARRVICEAEPPAPSAQVSRAEAGSLRTGIDRATFARGVRGDLDWIVLRCLEKDRNRRYGTASELAADLERHLRNEPVHAGPPTVRYRLGKFARRYRASLAAAAAMVVLLVAGAAGTTLGMLRARAAQATSAAAEAQARREASQVTALNEFLRDMFRAARPDGQGGGSDVRVADVLARAEQTLPQKFHGQPEAEVRARLSLGNTYSQLGLRPSAIENFSIGHAVALKHLGADADLTLHTAAFLAFVVAESAPDRRAEAEALARQTYETVRAKHGDAHPLTFFAGNSWGSALHNNRDLEQAKGVLTRLVEQQRDRPELAQFVGNGTVIHNLAGVLRSMGDLAGAEKAEREAVAREVASPRQRANIRRQMGEILAEQGKLEEAAAAFREALAAQPQLGHGHPLVERVSHGYLKVLVRQGKTDEALRFARRRLDEAAAARPRDDALVAERTAELAELLNLAGHHQEAESTFEQAIAQRKAVRAAPNAVTWRNRVLQAVLGRHHAWTSETIRAHVWRALDEALADQPHRIFALDRQAMTALHFRLLRWNGRPYAPPGEQATLLAQGGLAELGALSEPAEGLYVLAVDVPVETEPLRAVEWLLVTPWEQSLYPISRVDWRDERAWRALTAGPPAECRMAVALYRARGLTVPPGPNGRDDHFGLVATAPLRLASGHYRFSVTSDDGCRIELDGRRIGGQWVARGPATDEAVAELTAAAHTLRVDYFQLDQGYTLWLGAEPLTGPAAVFAARLWGRSAQDVRREALAYGARFEGQRRWAEAAGRYRLAGEVQDVIAGRGPDERVRKLREEAAGLDRQGRYEEAAAAYRRALAVGLNFRPMPM